MRPTRTAALGTAACGLALIILAGCGVRYADPYYNSHGSQPRLVLHFTDPQAAVSGEWESAGIDTVFSERHLNEWLNLEIVDATRSRTQMSGVPIKDFDWTAANALEASDQPLTNRLEFALRRPAGEILFSGRQELGEARGEFQIKPDPDFSQQVEQLCAEKPGANDCLLLILRKASLDDLRQLKDCGYTVSLADFIRLYNYGLSVDYARDMRQAIGAISIDQLIQLRNHGLTAQYARDFKSAGYSFPPQELIKLRNHAVTADFAAALKKGGFNLNSDELVRLRNSGVSADYATGLKRAGYGGSIEQIVRLRNTGISVDYCTGVQQAGYDLSADQVVQLRNSGVGVDYLAAVKKAGYDFTMEELIRLRNHGVSAEYLADLIESGRKPLPADIIIQMRSRGVSADTVREIRRY
jgi:hypothetical protein